MTWSPEGVLASLRRVGVMGTTVPGTLGVCPPLRLLRVFWDQQLLLIPPSNLKSPRPTSSAQKLVGRSSDMELSGSAKVVR